MTLQRRVRRRPSAPDPCERLRALAPGTAPADESRPPAPPGAHPTAPGPPAGDAEQPPLRVPPIPGAPYAVAAPEAPGARAGTPPAAAPRPGAAPRATDTAWESEAAAPTAERPAVEPAFPEVGPRGCPDRPPSGYEEIRPEPPGPLLARIAERWPVGAAPSRRAVLALTVLGLIAVGAALLTLRDRPEAVTAEVVAAASAAEAGTGTPDAADGARSGAAGTGGTAGGAPREDLVVHVGGEVAEPGLYTVPPGSRVADAVAEAGGALPDADLDTLNLARPLVDGEQVLVGVPSAGSVGEAPAAGRPVDVNRADVTALMMLPRIGEVIAAEIVAHREAHGPFASVDALVEVNGIGDRTLETLRPYVTVG